MNFYGTWAEFIMFRLYVILLFYLWAAPKDRHPKRKSSFLLVKIQEHFEFLPDWYRKDSVRGLILDYYFFLRSALKTMSRLRPCLARCRHCRIFFLTPPQNAGRKDLGCPFGCQDAHRKQRSTERSTAYNHTEAGKRKKKQQNGKRRKPRPDEGNGKSAGNPPEAGGLRLPAPLTPAKSLPAQSEVADFSPSSVEGVNEPSPSPKYTAVQGGDPYAMADKASCDRQTLMLFDRRQSGPGQTGNDTGSVPLAKDTIPELLDRNDCTFNAGMVEYVRVVTGSIEDRRVSREEVLQMLKRIMRQHGLVREKRIDYRMRVLKEKPP